MDYAQDELKNRMAPISSRLGEPQLLHKLGLRLFMSEFLGTFMFVYLGQSCLTSFELMGTQNDIITRQLATILSYGLAFLMATLLTINLSGSHLNPAYTFARALYRYINWRTAFIYFSGQYLGAFSAATLLHATYFDKLAQRHSEGLLIGMNITLRAHGNILSTGKLFSSYPPTEVSQTQLFLSYTLATMLLMVALLFINESKLVNIPRYMKPFYLSAALVLSLAAFSANGGPVLNPAQDLAPRLYISLAGWGSSSFNLYHYNYWWICGLIAPHFGALIGFGLYELLSHLNNIEATLRNQTISKTHDYTTIRASNDFQRMNITN